MADEDIVSDAIAVDEAEEKILLLAITLVAETDSV